MDNITTETIKTRLIFQLCELLLQPSLSLQTLIQPRYFLKLDKSSLTDVLMTYTLSKLNLPHMFCLMISVWDVGEPLSSPQLLSGGEYSPALSQGKYFNQISERGGARQRRPHDSSPWRWDWHSCCSLQDRLRSGQVSLTHLHGRIFWCRRRRGRGSVWR